MGARQALCCLLAAGVVAGCGGGAKSTPAKPVPRAPFGRAAPSPSIDVSPLTTAPGGRIRVTVHVHAGSVRVKLSGKGGKASATAALRGANRFVASLTVPKAMRGGSWPVVATYRSAGQPGRLRAQVKVVTP